MGKLIFIYATGCLMELIYIRRLDMNSDTIYDTNVIMIIIVNFLIFSLILKSALETHLIQRIMYDNKSFKNWNLKEKHENIHIVSSGLIVSI